MKPDEMLSAAIRYILARDEWGPELNEAMNALDRLSEQGELERLASVNRVLEMVKRTCCANDGDGTRRIEMKLATREAVDWVRMGAWEGEDRPQYAFVFRATDLESGRKYLCSSHKGWAAFIVPMKADKEVVKQLGKPAMLTDGLEIFGEGARRRDTLTIAQAWAVDAWMKVGMNPFVWTMKVIRDAPLLYIPRLRFNQLVETTLDCSDVELELERATNSIAVRNYRDPANERRIDGIYFLDFPTPVDRVVVNGFCLSQAVQVLDDDLVPVRICAHHDVVSLIIGDESRALTVMATYKERERV